MKDIVNRLRWQARERIPSAPERAIEFDAANEIESLRAQLAEVTRELKVLSDFCEGAEDRSLLHKGGLKCLVDAVQKQSDNYARALAAGSKRIAEIHQIEQQLAEVTKERDDALFREYGVTQQLLATQAQAARMAEALEDTLQTLCWQCFGECRNITPRRILEPTEAEIKARAALSAPLP